MPIRRQDIAILIFYYVGYSRIRNLILRLKKIPVTRFVTFHDVPTDALNCFETNLKFLKKHTNVVSFNDFMSGRLSLAKTNVVITFDDGFKSWITQAVPILRNLALPATFFISSGFIGLSKDDESAFIQSKLLLEHSHHQRGTGGLTHNDVKEIAKLGFTIGGHTLNHCNLSSIQDIAQLKNEIIEDKLRLEKITGVKINYFSYPLGAYQNQNINITEVLKASGYRAAVITASGNNNPLTDPYHLYRELTGAGMSPAVFKARVSGNYDAVRSLKKILSIPEHESIYGAYSVR